MTKRGETRGSAQRRTSRRCARSARWGAGDRWRPLAGPYTRGRDRVRRCRRQATPDPVRGHGVPRFVGEDLGRRAPRRCPAPARRRRAGAGNPPLASLPEAGRRVDALVPRRHRERDCTKADGLRACRPARSATFRLSTVSGRSQTATLLHSVDARARPSDSARVVVRLRAQTPEHVPHVVYLLGGRIDRAGRYWLRVRLPILPNGSPGWIPRNAVAGFRTVDTHLVIDRARLRITLLRRGRPIFRSIIGVGEPRWPTPAGRFYVRERLTGFTDPSTARSPSGRTAARRC
jgi:hypothetical protein